MTVSKKEKKTFEVKAIIQSVQEKVTRAEIGSSSATIAYYLLVSIFPLMIAIGNLLPFFKLDAEKTLPYIQMMIPSPIFQMLSGTIEDLLSTSNGGWLSISALTTVWASSRSIGALQTSINKIYGVEGQKNMIVKRLLSFGTIFIFLIAIIIIAIVFTVGQRVLDSILPTFNLSPDILLWFTTLKWPITMGALFVTMSLIYAVLPNAKVSFRSVVPGAILSTVGWMLLSQFFGLYTKIIATGLSSYGIIAGFVIFMLWLNFSAVIIMVGGILNAVIADCQPGGIQQRAHTLALPVTIIKDKIKKEAN